MKTHNRTDCNGNVSVYYHVIYRLVNMKSFSCVQIEIDDVIILPVCFITNQISSKN
jgi:hypothetical protein